jgi:EAL domain-containing protein (putative c-di-GMP-specific phosphodiesterase class I)
LDHTRGELSRSEKSGKEAEINLSLQSVRHDQIVSDLRRELATLKAHPKLDDIVAELEERNRDMDELLKNKCAEIEENDDRILE